ncbi:MAG: DNA topoisomerase IV subunit A [Prevotella sp.]|nr:DNA topoisomerase IV subunit A [Staphylococcus sp.]MCM1349685.1 DNA topoisomerase IV subunit A [Prevotella sp.]
MSSTSKKVEKFVETYMTENFENIMGDRFGRYSKYIIQDRALPDVRDGLKPVQRRILFAMFKLGLTSNKPFKKSARIVGDVIGKYHPHGDTAVYDAMVRMSQEFKILLPLVDMHGNNGSIDGDPAAAMRYTEARMSKFSELMLEDIHKHTVGFVPNFDDEELEPIVLPSKFPNVLVNGASGISAGYATEIPPHNPGEVIDATIYRIEHPNCTTDELMQFVQGPDFPTGAIVQGIDGLKDAYETGRGKVIVTSKYEIDTTKVEPRIIVTEIPFDVNKAVLLRKMSDVLQAKGVDGVKMIRDESSRQGQRIVIDIRRDVNPETILSFLLKQTDLQTSYNFNMVAISQGRPMQMGLADILDAYIAHQKEVITNKCNFELEKDLKRSEVVQGLISMVSILDAVIATIRNSKNKSDAKENIISKYGFTEIQAEAIVMLQLYRLTNTDIFALKTEQKELEQEIKKLRHILSSETALIKVIVNELARVKQAIDRPRKTQVQHNITEVEVKTEEFIAKEDVILMITHDGYLKRLSKKAFFGTNEPTKLKEGDVISDIYEVSTTDTLIQFTDRGNYVFLPIHKIPESKHKDQGIHVSTLIGMETNEKVIFSFPVSDFNEEKYVLLATKSGLIKRIQLSSLYVTRYSKALKATKLKDDDAVVSADVAKGSQYEVVIATKDGFMNRYDASEVSVIEPASFGVKSIELKNRPNDYVVGAKYVSEKDIVLVLTNRGNIKRMRPEEINKGKKNNVGKMYLKAVRSNMHEAIDLEVIHAKNANSDLASYVFCEKGFIEIDYTILRTAIADNGKKFVPAENGKPYEIVICRNDMDLEL